jgi:hypothetical protein
MAVVRCAALGCWAIQALSLAGWVGSNVGMAYEFVTQPKLFGDIAPQEEAYTGRIPKLFQAAKISLRMERKPPVDRCAALSASIASAPFLVQRIPARFMRCCTT